MQDSENLNKKLDHLFRRESGKMVSVITRMIGFENIETAEDVVQDTLIAAMRTWGYKGVPEQPKAWLYKVAKNKAIDKIRKNKREVKYQTEVGKLLHSEWSLIPTVDKLFLENEIEDSQLRMMFACCHPRLSTEYQICLILKILAGFSTKELARAFLSNTETINKRLYRAKKLIREENIKLDFPGENEIYDRVSTVHRVIYLIFNEGYNSASEDSLLRKDLCNEAVRLCNLILNFDKNNNTYSLMALMYFHNSRQDARFDEEGKLVTLDNQDRRKWKYDLIQKGFEYFERAGNNFSSKYHIEAAISAVHCTAEKFEDTNWKLIVEFYDKLLQLEDSPSVKLSRSVAISYYKGVETALKELEKLSNLSNYYLYYSTKANFLKRINRIEEAVECLEKAIELTENIQEKKYLKDKILIYNK